MNAITNLVLPARRWQNSSTGKEGYIIASDRQYLDYPFVGVGAVVWKDDRFLLIKRGKPPRKGAWSIPGGRQKLGETTREAAIREVREETGLEVEITRLIDVVDSIQRDEDGVVRWHATLVDFAAVWISGEAQAGTDADDARWFRLENLEELGLWRETERIIRESAAPDSKN